MKVFFYGLFMDEDLLAEKGISPRNAVVGSLDGFALRIGERATLLRSAGTRSYGVVMDVGPNETKALYTEPSVADYAPEPVAVELADGSTVDAVCYNLPVEKVTGTNTVYAKALMEVARRLDFPDSYLDQIRYFLPD